MARKIVITSGKGGVGKTTIVANLGLALASRGENVVLVDLDAGLNNLDLALGVEQKIVFDLTDVLEGRCRIKQALVNCPGHESLFVLACSHSISKQILLSNTESVINKLSENFEWIILDCPAGVGTGFENAISVANEAIVVVTPHISSIRDSDKVLSILAGRKLNSVSLAINRIRGDMVSRGEMIDAEEIINQLKTKLVGIIPESDEISLSSCLNFLKNSNRVAKQAFVTMANNLIHDKVTRFDYLSKYRGVFGLLRRMVRRRV